MELLGRRRLILGPNWMKSHRHFRWVKAKGSLLFLLLFRVDGWMRTHTHTLTHTHTHTHIYTHRTQTQDDELGWAKSFNDDAKGQQWSRRRHLMDRHLLPTISRIKTTVTVARWPLGCPALLIVSADKSMLDIQPIRPSRFCHCRHRNSRVHSSPIVDSFSLIRSDWLAVYRPLPWRKLNWLIRLLHLIVPSYLPFIIFVNYRRRPLGNLSNFSNFSITHSPALNPIAFNYINSETDSNEVGRQTQSPTGYQLISNANWR